MARHENLHDIVTPTMDGWRESDTPEREFLMWLSTVQVYYFPDQKKR
jgi:hypothetical protein